MKVSDHVNKVYVVGRINVKITSNLLKNGYFALFSPFCVPGLKKISNILPETLKFMENWALVLLRSKRMRVVICTAPYMPPNEKSSNILPETLKFLETRH